MKFICEDWLRPQRSTSGSAGYDFIAPEDIIIPARWMKEFDTKVQIELDQGTYMRLEDRSSLARKGIHILYHGIIDSDYHYNIRTTLCNESSEPIKIEKGQRYMQGIINQYLVTDDDGATGTRTGGFGSTGA